MNCKNWKKLSCLIAVLALGVFANTANAALVLLNGGFDDGGSVGTGSGSTTVPNWVRDAGNGVFFGGAPGITGGPTTSPNTALLNSGITTFTGTTFSQTMGGTMDATTIYEVSFDSAIRDQGQWDNQGGALANKGLWDLTVTVTGSIDGVLATQDFADDYTSTNTWHAFDISWDSTGLDLSQDVMISITADSSSTDTHQQLIVDSLSMSATAVPEPSSYLLLIIGVGMLSVGSWRRRKS